jgi:hypothetical protein
LFYKLFKVRVNPTKIRTIEDIKLYGTPTTGNEDYDRELAKNEEIVMLSIAQMEDIYNQGYPVKIVNYEDTKTIYELISKHLVAMKNNMVLSENTTNDPKTLDELIRLDRFADSLFAHARYQMKQDVPTSALAARMRGDRFSALGRRRQTQSNAPVVQGKGSGSLRDYSTGADAAAERQQQQMAAQQPPNPREVDELPEDPNLPKRLSLEKMFENQKRMGMNWGG